MPKRRKPNKAAMKRRQKAIETASTIFVSGRAKQSVVDLSVPVLERSLQKIKRQGDPLAVKISGELARRQSGGKRGGGFR